MITKVIETFDPSAIVLQCGTDSLSGDKLGSFNLSMKGATILYILKNAEQGPKDMPTV